MKKSEIHILVVDDDASICEVFKQAIRRAGMKVSAVQTPNEAESIAKVQPVHLAIIDCMLPVINGVELAKKLKGTTMIDAPILLMSGVFKDAQFSQDALEKSGADHFYSKPLDIDQVLIDIRSRVAHLVEAKSGSLDSVLTKTEVSKRESKKLLDFIEDATGYDLMIVINVLGKAKTSGYLNITHSNGELIGLSIKDGVVVDVDTLKNKHHVSDLLEQNKLMEKEDFKAIVDPAFKKDPLSYLVKANELSPHMLAKLKFDKILQDLNMILDSGDLKFNFAENKSIEATGVEIDQEHLDNMFYEFTFKKIPSAWLADFYSDFQNKKIGLIEDIENTIVYRNIQFHEDFLTVYEKIQEGMTLSDLSEIFKERQVYSIVHFLAVSRVLYFTDEQKKHTGENHIKRVTEMFEGINGKNPFDIFRFFGASETVTYNELQKIYSDFMSNYHPKKLPKDASPAIAAINNKLLEQIEAAYKVLNDNDQRQALLDQIGEEKAKEQIKSEELTDKSRILLEKQKYVEAFTELKEAMKLHPAPNTVLCYTWARAKVEPQDLKKEIGTVRDMLSGFEKEDRSTALYYFVSGLLEALIANKPKAEAHFNRALEFERNYLPARRELAQLKASGKTSEKSGSDFLTGDITSIVKDLFGKSKKSS